MKRLFLFFFCLGLFLHSYAQGGNDGQKASWYMFRNSDSASYYSLRMVKTAGDSASFYYGRFMLGQWIYWQGYIDSSLVYYDEAESFFSRTKDTRRLIEVYAEKGNALKVITQYDKSYDYLVKALNLAESSGAVRWQTMICIYLAEHARAMGSHASASIFMEQAFNLHDESPLEGDDLAELYHRKAALEHQFGSPENAYAYSLKSLKISERTGQLHHQATSYNELGFFYENHRPDDSTGYNKPLEYYFKADAIWKKLNFRRYYIWVWKNIAREYARKHRFGEANQLLRTIVSTSEDSHWEQVAGDASLQLANNYEAIRKKDSALFYYKKFIDYSSRVSDRIRSVKLQEVMVKHATHKKEELLQKQMEKTELAKMDAQKTTSQRNFILFLLAVLLLLFIVITYQSVTIKRKNAFLAASHNKIRIINKKLESELNQKNILLAELHHRVKNNLAILSGLINLQKETVNDNLAKEILQDCQNRIYSIAMIHRNLYSINDSENINFEIYLRDLAESLINSYKRRKENIECTVDLKDVYVNITKAVPLALIVNELFSNSLKHAFGSSGGGRMGVTGFIENALLHLSVYDIGPGFSVDMDNLPTSSLGLNLVKMLSEQMDAEFRYEYTEGKSEFTFLIPLGAIKD